DPEQALRLISEWWEEEQQTFVQRYENATYPAGFRAMLPWPGEDGWDTSGRLSARSCWLLVFIHSALVPLGFNMIGRDVKFSQFLVSENWLSVLSRASEEPEAVFVTL